MKRISEVKEDSQEVHFVKVEDLDSDGESTYLTRRAAADVSVEQSRRLLSSGGYFDSQTTDTQFFGFESGPRSDGSPEPKRMKVSSTPSVMGTPSPCKATVKKETEDVSSLITLRTPKHAVQTAVVPSPSKVETEAHGVKAQVSKIIMPLDAEELEDEDDEYIEARMDSLVQELGRARMHVETLEKQLVTFVSVRYARMKTILAVNRTGRSNDHSNSPPPQETQTWDDHGHLSESPYYPSIETQIYRTITAGYEGRIPDAQKWLI